MEFRNIISRIVKRIKESGRGEDMNIGEFFGEELNEILESLEVF